ncbi:hypothetical protein FH972_024320 [Carpinus fangiana]|uniref:non-specific serine/threonine protein kinase n=1 Tax=Carpinus fangiana TaxID=176857 RepID=A0A5N6KY38_9ROSI|nr:hypothetical protein FH972_024320 [Carpinus fangiana]
MVLMLPSSRCAAHKLSSTCAGLSRGRGPSAGIPLSAKHWIMPKLCSLRQAQPSSSFTLSNSLPANVPVDEEKVPEYDPTQFFPVKPGDKVDKGRYEVLLKLGWGRTSTVWWRWQSPAYVTIKFTNRDADERSVKNELALLERIENGDIGHRGRLAIRQTKDHFTAIGPYGSHLCLVYEPMRESLDFFRWRFEEGRLPLPFIKGYAHIILYGLEYLHATGIVHTDLKLDNIMLTYEDPAILKDYVETYNETPLRYKQTEDRMVFESHRNFGPPKSKKPSPRLSDFGLAQIADGSQHPIKVLPIQPDYYRAPEVILGGGWSYSADIWNFALMIWQLVTNNDLFYKLHDPSGFYHPELHLAQMAGAIGSAPPEMVQREAKNTAWRWEPEIDTKRGDKKCDEIRSYFRGPFFDHETRPRFELGRAILLPRFHAANASLVSRGEKNRNRVARAPILTAAGDQENDVQDLVRSKPDCGQIEQISWTDLAVSSLQQIFTLKNVIRVVDDHLVLAFTRTRHYYNEQGLRSVTFSRSFQSGTPNVIDVLQVERSRFAISVALLFRGQGSSHAVLELPNGPIPVPVILFLRVPLPLANYFTWLINRNGILSPIRLCRTGSDPHGWEVFVGEPDCTIQVCGGCLCASVNKALQRSLCFLLDLIRVNLRFVPKLWCDVGGVFYSVMDIVHGNGRANEYLLQGPFGLARGQGSLLPPVLSGECKVLQWISLSMKQAGKFNRTCKTMVLEQAPSDALQ